MEEYGASSIKVLEGLEAVRKRPGMYIGSVSTSGMNHLIYEIVDNAVDEHLAGYCDQITVTIQEDMSVIVSDNGRGIPVGMHEKGVPAERLVFTTLHAGGKFDNTAYKTSGGLHGVGSSVVNALSEYLEVKIMTGGKIYYDAYQRGEPDTLLDGNGLLPVIGKTKKTGTTVTFLPDEEIFGKVKYNTAMVKSRLHETAYLNPGLEIIYTCEIEGEKETVTYKETEGITAYVRELNKGKEPKTEIISFKGKSEDIEAEIAFQFVDTFEEKLLGYCNNIYTSDGGTHLTGFKTKFTQEMNSYARELGLLKDKDANFTGPDTRCGLTAVIAIKHHDPLFEGQTKTKLGSADAARAVSNITGEQMELYCDKNIETVKAMIACAMKSAKLRQAEEKAKSNLLGKQKYSFDGNGKLANCESRVAARCEIFIVEGDSAGGSAKKARDRMYQAIMPIRGKILNVEKASIDKVLANAEIKSMIQAFGCGFSEGYGNDFDISKLRYDKIIIMADADVDGAHICTLLLTFFYRFMPELISEGHIYVAMPPLYKVVPSGKEAKGEYLYDDKALEDYRKKNRNKNFTLQRYKGLGEMDAAQLWETTMDPDARNLRQVSIEDARMANEVTEVLMGSDVEPRRDFIYTHAKEAELDLA